LIICHHVMSRVLTRVLPRQCVAFKSNCTYIDKNEQDHYIWPREAEEITCSIKTAIHKVVAIHT
jgi:hypothetical protein